LLPHRLKVSNASWQWVRHAAFRLTDERLRGELTDVVERSGTAFGRAAGSGKMPRSIPDAQGTTPVSLLRAFASWRLRDQTQRRRGAKTQRTDQGASELAKLFLAPNSFRDFQSPRTSRLRHAGPRAFRMKPGRPTGVAWSRIRHQTVYLRIRHRKYQLKGGRKPPREPKK